MDNVSVAAAAFQCRLGSVSVFESNAEQQRNANEFSEYKSQQWTQRFIKADARRALCINNSSVFWPL